MISVTLCPHCKKQVGIPAGTHESAEAQCPRCNQPFKLVESYPQDLPQVTVIDPGDLQSAIETEIVANDASDTSQSPSATGGFPVDAVQDGSRAFSDSPDVPGDDHLVIPASSADVSDTPFTGTTSGTAAATPKTRTGPGPLANVIGIVVFGIVGLGLGFGVLLFFGKAEPIIKMLPASVQKWFVDSDGPQRDPNNNDGNWKIGGMQSENEKPVRKQSTSPKSPKSEGNLRDNRKNNRAEPVPLQPSEPKTYRTFTDKTGKFHTSAQFKKLEGGKVFLEEKSGKEISVRMGKLSTDDQKWVRGEIKRRRASAKGTKSE